MLKHLMIIIIICILTIYAVLPTFAESTAYVTVLYTDDSSPVNMLTNGREIEIKITNYNKIIGYACVACYDENGQLLRLYSKQDVYSEYKLALTPDESIDIIKVFAWEGVDSLTPLMESRLLWKAMESKKPIGSGTEEDPYKVTSAQELAYIFVENDKEYILMNDIDLSSLIWRPSTFCGKFDGQGHSITGITVFDYVTCSGLVSYLVPISVPLDEFPYGYFIPAYIKNVNVQILDSGKYAKESGGIAGNMQFSSYIENCTSSGNIIATGDIDSNYVSLGNAGGIAGAICGGEINNCRSSADVTAYGKIYASAGGIVGESFPYIDNNYPKIYSCISEGKVSAISFDTPVQDNHLLAGGIVGENYGDIINCKTYARLYSDGLTGGIAGVHINDDIYARIINCEDNSTIDN